VEVVVDPFGDEVHNLSEATTWKRLRHEVVSQELARGVLGPNKEVVL
jgi:hypothetical protein